MERMEEEIENSEYRAYQQFVSNSNWDCDGLFDALAWEAFNVLATQKQKNSLPTGYIIDEFLHLKKGKRSVGVSHQHAGVTGKVVNCQVGVYASLVNDHATIINDRLFLPEAWVNDNARFKLAGIPEKHQSFRTKPQLALEMLKQDIARDVKFDWFGGDSLYGHSYELGKAIDDLNLFFMLDVHKDETVYLEESTFGVTENKNGRGRTAKRAKALQPEIRIDKIIQQLTPSDWKFEDVHDSVKGKIRLFVFKIQVWTRNGKEPAPRKRILIITKLADKHAKIDFLFFINIQ